MASKKFDAYQLISFSTFWPTVRRHIVESDVVVEKGAADVYKLLSVECHRERHDIHLFTTVHLSSIQQPRLEKNGSVATRKILGVTHSIVLLFLNNPLLLRARVEKEGSQRGQKVE